MTFARCVLGVIAIVPALMVPGLGRAQTCATDADCAKGWSCQTDASVAVPGVACAVDSDGGRVCTAVPAPTPAPVTSSCQPAPCTSAADCGPAMVCHREVRSNCNDVAPSKCAPNVDCPSDPVPQPVICTDTTVARCTYPWTLPCNADADCGTDFTCKPTEIAMCTGSASAPPAGGGSASSGSGGAIATPPTPPAADGSVAPTATCTVTTSFPGYCQAKVIACASDTDCPLAWSCATVNQATVATAPAVLDGGPNVVPPPALTPEVSTAPTKACQPAGTGTRGGTNTEDGGGGTYQPPTVSLGLPDAGPGPTKGGTSGAASVPDAGTATTANTPPIPTTSQGGNTSESTPVAARTSNGGCSVAPGASAASLAGVLVAFGLLVVRRRRR